MRTRSLRTGLGLLLLASATCCFTACETPDVAPSGAKGSKGGCGGTTTPTTTTTTTTTPSGGAS